MTALTRGSLPPGVYWRRRLFVLGLVAAVVVLVGGFVRGVSGPEPDGGVAQQAAAEPSASADTPAPQPGQEPAGRPTEGRTGTSKGTDEPDKSQEPPPLPEPEGKCSASDVVVEPKVGDAVAGRDVATILKLRTQEAEACTFDMSAKSVTLTITSGSDEIWASRHCPEAIPEEELVVRQDTATRVRLTWNAKRSDEGCTRYTQWALPGWYHLAAASLGGEPATAKFELERPQAPEDGGTRPDKQRPQEPEPESDPKPENKQEKNSGEKLHRTER